MAGEDLQPGDAVDALLELELVVVVAHRDAVLRALLRRGVERLGGGLDVGGRGPVETLDVRVDHRADAEPACGVEDLVLVGTEQGCMAGRRGESVGGQRLGQLLRGGDEVVRLDGGVAQLGDAPNGAREILSHRGPQGVELE
ncbi:hypothetical protein MN0502_30100 [Arthrobacter sp. MN05-02]|nr:hypothetical protein MN0502_30100 [Arthrobacter sp. MN05-02]